MTDTLYTIGHSTLPQEAFVELCHSNTIQVVCDVRSHPGSTHYPQFNRVDMQKWLRSEDIGYFWLPELGGWRSDHFDDEYLRKQMLEVGVDLAAYAGVKFPKQRIARGRENTESGPAWTNQGLYDYSWFMATEEFRGGIKTLKTAALSRAVAICCAEVLWWKCHRSMIADWMVMRENWEVVHLQPRLTNHSESMGNRWGRYDPRILTST